MPDGPAALASLGHWTGIQTLPRIGGPTAPHAGLASLAPTPISEVLNV